MQQGSNSTYNLITIVFLVMTVVVFAVSLLILGGAFEPPAALQIPTDVPSPAPISLAGFAPTAEVPATPTLTPYSSVTPTLTWTPSETPSASATPTLTATNTPTDTVSPTPSLTTTASLTPTNTFTFTPTATETVPTNTPVPPTNTPRPIQFQRDPNTPIYRTSVNGLVCGWQGIGGNVVSSGGAPLVGYQIRVTGSDGLPLPLANTGSNILYGGGGWEVTVGTSPFSGQYTIEVLANDGSNEPVSRAEVVSFPGNCNTNLAIINFVQTNP